MNFLAAVAPAAPAEASGLSINFFWVIVTALSFIIFLNLIWRFGFDPIADILAQRKARLDQGLADAAQAAKDREAATTEHDRLVADARREATSLMAAAQLNAQHLREADLAATRVELDRMREKALADIEAEKDRALAELRSQVADLALAAAGKVIGETMTEPRQRRLVEEFLKDDSALDPRRTN